MLILKTNLVAAVTVVVLYSGLRFLLYEADLATTQSISRKEDEHSHSKKRNHSHPWLRTTDLIHSDNINTSPIVIEEYNTVFFLMAKVASTEFLRFITRLQGNPHWCKSGIHLHYHNMTLLSKYSVEEAQEMMTSPKWKKVIFVRHPKARILSAFLDKAVDNSVNFVDEFCGAYGRKGHNKNECIQKHKDFDFFVKKFSPVLNTNVHWRTIYSRIDEKWWPYIDFIGNMDSLRDDAEEFFSSIHSNIDGVSAWDRVGKSGWSGKHSNDCSDNLSSPKPFLGVSDASHTTHAIDKMKTYYTPELEKYIEHKYADDLTNPFFEFSPISLFPKDES